MVKPDSDADLYINPDYIAACPQVSSLVKESRIKFPIGAHPVVCPTCSTEISVTPSMAWIKGANRCIHSGSVSKATIVVKR